MEESPYFYQSTLNNFIPFVVEYQHLSSSFSKAVDALTTFNSSFKEYLLEVNNNSNRTDIPTVRNLYEEVVYILKDVYGKTSTAHLSLQQAAAQISANSQILNLMKTNHFSHLAEISQRFTDLKQKLKDTKQRSQNSFQQLQLLSQSELVTHFYKQIYKERPKSDTRNKSKLETQLAILNAKTQCLQEAILNERQKNCRMFDVMAGELEEFMVSTSVVRFGNLKESFGSFSGKERDSGQSEYGKMEESMGQSGVSSTREEEMSREVEREKRQAEEMLDGLEVE